MTHTPKQLADRALIRRAQRGDVAARNQLIEENTGFIVTMIQKATGRRNEWEDYLAVSVEAYIRAVAGFDFGVGACLNTYAGQAIYREVQKHRKRNARHAHDYVQISDELPVLDYRRREDADTRDIISVVRQQVESLTLPQRIVINGRMQGLTLQRIGRMMGLSCERVRQIEADAHEQMREPLESLM